MYFLTALGAFAHMKHTLATIRPVVLPFAVAFLFAQTFG